MLTALAVLIRTTLETLKRARLPTLRPKLLLDLSEIDSSE
jgi:hypothetical protein